jgi:hypothetical protein
MANIELDDVVSQRLLPQVIGEEGQTIRVVSGEIVFVNHPGNWGDVDGNIEDQLDLIELVDDAVDEAMDYTDDEIAILDAAKQDELVSATNIKTVNGQSILGSGNLQTSQITLPLAADDTYKGETIAGLNNNGGVSQWDAVCLNSSSEWIKADANGSGTYPALGLAVETRTTGQSTEVLTRGIARNDAWSLTPQGLVFLDTTAGGITQTPPSSSGDKVQVIGVALTADVLYVNPELGFLTIS